MHPDQVGDVGRRHLIVMLLKNIKIPAPLSHGPIDVPGPAETGRLDLQPEPGVAAQERFTRSRALLVGGVDGDQHIQIWIGLGSQTLQRNREFLLSSIDGHTDGHQRTIQCLLSSRMRPAQISAK